MKDLVVLVPDKNVKFALESLLSRCESLQIRKISYDIFVHPSRDPGVYHHCGKFLRSYSREYLYALIFLDHEGSGQERLSPEKMQKNIKTELGKNGWKDKSEVIVFLPEFDIWAWVDSPHTAKAMGWNTYEDLKTWLIAQNLWENNAIKPSRPKEAIEKSLRAKQIPRSSSIYQAIAEKASLKKCQDKSFQNFRSTLQTWFAQVSKEER